MPGKAVARRTMAETFERNHGRLTSHGFKMAQRRVHTPPTGSASPLPGVRQVGFLLVGRKNGTGDTNGYRSGPHAIAGQALPAQSKRNWRRFREAASGLFGVRNAVAQANAQRSGRAVDGYAQSTRGATAGTNRDARGDVAGKAARIPRASRQGNLTGPDVAHLRGSRGHQKILPLDEAAAGEVNAG